MTENFRPTVLRNQAWEALKGKWGNAAVAGLVILLIAGAGSTLGRIHGAGSLLSLLYTLFVGQIVTMGGLFLFLDMARKGDVAVDTLWEGFKDYGRYLKGALVVFLFTFLWYLLLIVPGIIKGLSYSMTYYIMRENPEMGGNDARKLSMQMMEGHKMDLFLLGLSFIGWLLLGIITLGIGLCWVIPYIYTAMGRFWDTLKAEAKA